MLKNAFQALRTTPLRLMVLTQALAIAALLAVLMTADRYQQLFTQEAAQMLGGDLVLNSDREPPAGLALQAQNAGLQAVQMTQFASVVLANAALGEQQTLVSAKAVSGAYPLRGKLLFKQGGGVGAPARGSVWVDEAVLNTLGLSMGQSLAFGQSRLTIAGVIAQEPDRGVQFGSFAPRLMLNHADLAATQLLGEASRATYRWAFAGNLDAVARFSASLKPQLQAGQRLETLDEGRPEMRTTLDRASRFLGLVAILTTLIAACGLALVAQVWASEQTQWVAILRTLGASTGTVARRVAGVVAWVSALGLALGIAAGYGLQALLAHYLMVQENVVLPASGAKPLLQAVALLCVLVVACIAAPIRRLLQTRPMAVLRPADTQSQGAAPWLVYGLALVCSAGLLVWVAGSAVLGSYILLALLAVMVVLAGGVWGVMQLAIRFGRSHASWLVRTASRGLLRNPVLTLVQASTLTLALLGVLTLGLLQKDVLGAWQNALPKNAPNHFVLNVQPDQAVAVEAALKARGIAAPQMMPMIRARLIEVNGKPVGPADYDSERAKRLVDREFNMSYLAALPAGNSVTQGTWQGDTAGALSMEEGIMQTLALKLGDALRFDVGGQTMDLKVGSVRKLRWESLNVNFFAITSAASAQDLPHTFITAVRVPVGLNLSSLVRQFPNLTVIDVTAVASQAQSVLDKVTQALQLLFGLSVLAGVLVVAVSSYATRVVRLKEAVLLRVMGASSQQVRGAQLLEQAGLGALAGLVAGCVAYVLVWGLAVQVLELPVVLGLWPLWLGVGLGAVLSVAGGLTVLLSVGSLPLAQRVRVLGG